MFNCKTTQTTPLKRISVFFFVPGNLLERMMNFYKAKKKQNNSANLTKHSQSLRATTLLLGDNHASSIHTGHIILTF